jgi:AraC family transcriptional regulator
VIRYTPLLRGDSLAVGRFDHPLGNRHEDPAEEISEAYSVNFVEYGRFDIKVGRQSWSLSSGNLFLTCPGLAYRCQHSDPSPADVCLAVEFRADDDVSHELARLFSRSVRQLPVYALTNRLAYLKHGLRSGSRDRLRTEAAAHELIFAILDGAAAPVRHRYHARQLSWYAERVNACRERMDRDYASDLSLASLARSVGMSPFHFARIFSELAGMPPHRYLLQVRLQAAAFRLRQGDTVTNACYASGFQNLSHFTRLFQRHIGLLPSCYGKQQA